MLPSPGLYATYHLLREPASQPLTSPSRRFQHMSLFGALHPSNESSFRMLSNIMALGYWDGCLSLQKYQYHNINIYIYIYRYIHINKCTYAYTFLFSQTCVCIYIFESFVFSECLLNLWQTTEDLLIDTRSLLV